jgi:transposase
VEVIVARSRNGEAIRPSRRTAGEIARLKSLLNQAEAAGDLEEWRRAKAVLGYIDGRRVIVLSDQFGVTRGSINRWLQWYDTRGVDGLRTRIAPGPAPRLSEKQRGELADVIEAGPLSVGFSSGVWTGPMIGDWIHRRFGVRYHTHYVPELLHQLGFSVQRPRKRLARADAEAQAHWLRKRLPAIKKKPRHAEESFSSRTKRASGSTERSTKPGHESASSLE